MASKSTKCPFCGTKTHIDAGLWANHAEGGNSDMLCPLSGRPAPDHNDDGKGGSGPVTDTPAPVKA